MGDEWKERGVGKKRENGNGKTGGDQWKLENGKQREWNLQKALIT